MSQNKTQHHKDVPIKQRHAFLSRREVFSLFGTMIGSSFVYNHKAFAQFPENPIKPLQDFLGNGQSFEVTKLHNLARRLAQTPYEETPSYLPDAFTTLSREQYESILPTPSSMIWGTEGRTIGVQPLHRGFAYTQRVELYYVEQGIIQHIQYNPELFDFGSRESPDKNLDLGFSGFRLVDTASNNHQPFAEIKGATFFCSKAKDQEYGPNARALVLRPADQRGEEIPAFKALWIERPGIEENAIVCHGLIDSPSTTGVSRFIFRPGQTAISDVEITLFPRETLDHVGFCGIGTSFYFGGTRRAPTDDFRPAAFKTDGLEVCTGRNEWLWRPLNNPNTLQVSAFIDKSPKGFGLIQRSRSFEDFLDDIHGYEKLPSTWIEPFTEFGEGDVQLIEIPSSSETNENILSYWRPRTAIKKGEEYFLSYRMYWCWDIPSPPPVAQVVSSRIGTIAKNSAIKEFVIDFRSENFRDLHFSNISYLLENNHGTIQAPSLIYLSELDIIRIRFKLDPGNAQSVELRLILKEGETALSETWLYRWTI